MSAEITWRSMPSAGMNHWRMSGIVTTEDGLNDDLAESSPPEIGTGGTNDTLEPWRACGNPGIEDNKWFRWRS
jgi:hypothetical protein